MEKQEMMRSPLVSSPIFGLSPCNSVTSLGSAKDQASVFSTTDPLSNMEPSHFTPQTSPAIGKSPGVSRVHRGGGRRRSSISQQRRRSSIGAMLGITDPVPWFRSSANMVAQVSLESPCADDDSDSQESTEQGEIRQWLSAIPLALPLFVLSYSSCVSYSEIIVTDTPLDANVVASMHLLSCGLTGIFLPLQSPCWLIVSSADITVTIFYKNIVQAVVRACLERGFSQQVTTATALLAIPFNTILVSLIFCIVGHYKATVVLSYLPYPVVAGFLASIGWAIFSGSLPIVGGESPHLADLPRFVQEHYLQLICTVAVACGSVCLSRIGAPARIHAVAPIILASGAFWLVLLMMPPGSQDDLKQTWLFDSVAAEPFWDVWTNQAPLEVSYPYLSDLSVLSSLGLVVLLSLALRTTGIERSTGISMSIDDEVKRTGIANLVTGLCGGVIGSHSPGLTTFNMTAGTKDARVAIIAAFFQLLLWLSGLPARNFLPRFMLAGILMNLGVVMLFEWMWASKAKVGVSGLIIIYAQVISSVMFGLLVSVLLGIVTTSIIYNGQLLTFSVLKYHVSGKSLRSPVRRPSTHQFILNREFDQVEAMGLDGYLSEGPMLRFTRYVQRYADEHDHLRFIIFDFRSCHQFTPWSCALLVKMDQFLRALNVTALYANAEPGLKEGLVSFGLDQAKNRTFDTLPEALVYCEDLILSQHGEETHTGQVLTDELLEEKEKLDEKRIAALSELLQCSPELAKQVEAHGQWNIHQFNNVLITQGNFASSLHFCLPRYSIVGELADTGRQARSEYLKIALHQMGTICGIEGVLYNEYSRSTFVVQDWNCHVLSMRKDDFKKLAAKEPAVKHCIEHVAALQFLHRGDSLAQVVDVSKGGGWRGARIDNRTATLKGSLLEIDFLSMFNANTSAPTPRQSTLKSR